MPDGGPTTIARIVEVAKRAEDLGFDAVAVSDHLFLDIEKYGGPPGRYETPEAFALLGALAAGTDRIGLETLVLCVPFRNPAVLAEQVRSLQELSDGRFTCGLGAGWYEPEFKHAGIPFGTPGSRIAALREAAAVLHSAEVAPIWIGGKGGPKILETVAAHGDAWNVCWRAEPGWVADRRQVLHDMARQAGRDPDELSVTVGLYTFLGRDEDDLAKRYEQLQAWTPGGALDEVEMERFAEGGAVGTIDGLRERMRAFADAGASEIIFTLSSLPFALADMEQLELAAELAGSMR
jgi:alkanesulfonate monooxygenase SsuD/methylene tetrahydromethanopterin reductase-like flavin-dependent oxidoreductase (luciferase family)